MTNKKTRCQVLTDADLAEEIETYCRRKRLDKLSGDLERMRRDEEMILESLALFIRFSIAMNANKPLPDKATMAIAHERYLRFVDQVGHQIARGRMPFGDKDEKETP